MGVNVEPLGLVPAAPPVLLDQPGIGKFRLRILVEHAHVGMGRGAVEVAVELLDVLAVVALQVVTARNIRPTRLRVFDRARMIASSPSLRP
jgi:hypothetical protein